MVVVADTSPLNYLVLLEAVDVLRQLYKRLCVPAAGDQRVAFFGCALSGATVGGILARMGGGACRSK